MSRVFRKGIGTAVFLLVAPALWGAGPVPQKRMPAQPASSRIAPVETVLPGRADIGLMRSYDERCQECHARDGNATEIGDGVSGIGKFPKLAGQSAEYIVKQIGDFARGKRHSDEMEIMARSLDTQDLFDIAAYYAALPAMRGPLANPDPLADALYRQGDAQRGIPACIGCHAERVAADRQPLGGVPRIAGQHERYLNKQLKDWRSGERRNDPGNVMNDIARKLSEPELDALARYLAGL